MFVTIERYLYHLFLIGLEYQKKCTMKKFNFIETSTHSKFCCKLKIIRRNVFALISALNFLKCI